ncbi:polysaccharide biosynthesis protein [bacterium]|nr:polysaccharide biosynthesis protein [bacterium]
MRLPKDIRLSNLSLPHLVTDALIITGSLFMSLYLRTAGTPSFDVQLADLARLVPIFLFIRILTFIATGTYDIIWRYVSLLDALKLVRAVFLSTTFIISATYLIDIGRVPRSVFLIDGILCTLLLAGIRITRRYHYEHQQSKTLAKNNRRRVLIYGAGDNGRLLASRLQTDQVVGYTVVGFVDDDPRKRGREIKGLPVLGGFEELDSLISTYKVQEVIVAITAAPGDLLRRVFLALRPHGIRPRLTTSLVQSAGNNAAFELYRTVELADLLSRPANRIDLRVVHGLLQNQSILITGAGGSIGSEIARQVMQAGPSCLILLDHSEFNLYQIDQELRVGENNATLVVPVLADLKDRLSIAEVFTKHEPQIVIHAAAYKHVHLVEANPSAAVLNNILGTRNLVEISQASKVRQFIQVSTDKAVSPVGIMGATKRICELLVTQAGRESGAHYCSVRFGNVLGSSGSLIPLLQRQIQNGEPVTITHKDMTRYFMLIPEAVSLVLMSARVTKSGDVAILKMGDPVKIVDIARSLIALMGKQEDEVPILFTGVRPGEKLYEELCLTGKEMPSEHSDIMILPGGDSEGWDDAELLHQRVDALIAKARKFHPDTAADLRDLLKNEIRLSAVPRPVERVVEIGLH